ncbi:electron transfer flavoprotein-ubiquinone oxidoreductase [Mesoterricola silvestris]|uniref:Electron transfer flavoprotein-ubiquinone oxidoreductase n=1 Tax=Mesoterricola silvestris TaxID=2927979 RepID=A0AA48GSZ2_9BACT|nr:electron-transfer flavoprotein:ubiquinone oxidoreductase [Mesoterricola silvestris]BDU71176.1 electron-transferring-flavoprotein dehydrogenase [Mesoterricola silvestris]
MPDFSTQLARPGVEREDLEFDVLFVGAGPANLAGLWRLLDLLEARKITGLTIGLIEKGDEIGDHAFSGAVLDPAALDELCPDWAERGFPCEGRVTSEEVWYFTERGGLKAPFPPPFLANHGFPIVSLSRMVRWMAAEIEKREVPGVDVMLLPGFAGIKVLWEDGRVAGVQTADRGVNADGSPRPTFEPGNNLRAKVTVFGEGPRGHLMRELDEVLGLQAGSVNPQVYETGAKEIWEIPAGRVPEGFVLHSAGWPQADGESGGSFVYRMGGDRLAVGYVVSLDTHDPFADAHLMLQKFKTHPRIKAMLAGGRMVQYGGKALAIGGWNSMPRLAFPGGMLAGDAAQMVNAGRLKGIHLAMKGGMCAAETIADALAEGDFGEASLLRYSRAYLDSWAGTELYRARNFHGVLAHGPTPGAVLKLALGQVTGGWAPGDPLRMGTDADATATTEAHYGREGLHRDMLDWGVKPDGALTFSKLDDVYASGTLHDEHQPGHLKIVKGDQVCVSCWETKGSPCTVFCPAQVYEMHPDAAGRVSRVDIAFSNCVHCKTCDIKCPEGNVLWTPPEGGGGPKYTLC